MGFFTDLDIENQNKEHDKLNMNKYKDAIGLLDLEIRDWESCKSKRNKREQEYLANLQKAIEVLKNQ